MVSNRLPTSESSSPFNNPLVTVSKAPIIIVIIVTFMFHIFFQFTCNLEVLILLFKFFQFYSVVSQYCKVYNFESTLFLLLVIIIRFGPLAEIRWSVCMPKSLRSLCVISPGQLLGCAYTICSYGQTEVSCTSPSGSPCLPSRV